MASGEAIGGRQRGGALAVAAVASAFVGTLRLDVRHHHEGAVPGGRLLPDLAPRAAQVMRSLDAGDDLGAPGRCRAQVRHVQVGIDDLAQGARDGRGRHQQHVRRLTLGRQRLALGDAEAVLLVDDDQVETGIRDRILQQRVRADHDLGLPRRDGLQGRSATRLR